MGLPARNPRLLVFQFPGPASAAERTQRHGRGGAGPSTSAAAAPAAWRSSPPCGGSRPWLSSIALSCGVIDGSPKPRWSRGIPRTLGANGVILPLIADGDPLARGWIPLPAVCVVSSGAAPAASNPKASATAAAAAAPTASAAATRTAMASAAMSRATASRAAMTPAAAATSAAAAVTCCKSQASAKRGLAFFVENVEGRQADVRDFLLSENNCRCGVLRRYIRCGGGC